MRSNKKSSGRFKLGSILFLGLGYFSLTVAGLAFWKSFRNEKILKRISKELQLEHKKIAINSDRWIKEKIAHRQAFRREKVMPLKPKVRFLTG